MGQQLKPRLKRARRKRFLERKKVAIQAAIKKSSK